MRYFAETTVRKFSKVFLSAFYGVKMVRFFENPYQDYVPGTGIDLKQDLVLQKIDYYIDKITKRLQPTRKNADGGLYVGITGVAYMFYHISKNPRFSDSKSLYVQKQIEYLAPALQTSIGDKTSFLLGDAGTWALAAVLYKDVDKTRAEDALKQYKFLYRSYLNPKFLDCGGEELFVGRAGYIAGALWLTRELEQRVLSPQEFYRICDIMVINGREYANSQHSLCPLMYHYYNTQYLGAAHGISFILQMLLTVPGYLEYNKAAAKDIKSTIDYLLSLQTQDGNWPCCMEEVGMDEHKLIHWCHGAPGTIYLMAKAYLVYNDTKYLNSCIRAGEVVWQKGLLRKGPGICHGVAGNGYVFLLLYRLTSDEKYLYRAKAFVEFLNSEEFQRDARLPDNPESLYEGSAGTVCFLSDLLMPEKAEFPFQDVFSTYAIF